MTRTARWRFAGLAAVATCALCAVPPSGVAAQQVATPGPAVESSVPQLEFQPLSEIALPGPLPPRGPRVRGPVVEIPVAGALARTGWSPGDAPELVPLGPDDLRPPPQSAWVQAPEGKHRYRALPSGWVEAQVRCRKCDQGWRPRWRLRVAGSTFTAPLVTRHRVYLGAMDNRVYGIKRRNGHRLWATEVGSRVTRPMVLVDDLIFDDSLEQRGKNKKKKRPLALLLLIPDSGSELIALDAVSGKEVATFTLPHAEDRLVGAPVVTEGGKVIVARQKYRPGEASLMVLELRPTGALADLPYNAADPPAEALDPPRGEEPAGPTITGR